MRSSLLIGLVLALIACGGAAVQPAVQPATADSLAVDTSAMSDTLRARQGMEVVVLADSARQAALDSAAVAVLADTTHALSAGLSEGVLVVFFGRTLFHVDGPVGPYSAVQRAERLSARLESLAANPNADTGALRTG